ncbi:MAG TPA: cytidine deaminase [Gemmata sp.]
MSRPDAATLEELIRRARKVSANAYCPYSNFPVGAAVLTDDGEVFEGCNVENASYGLSICAERSAIAQMVARGKRSIAAVVVCTPTPTPTSPCGACRQVINEFGSGALVVSACDAPGAPTRALADLLPDAFGPQNLNK